MKLLLMAVGRTSTPLIRQGIDDYLRRLSHYLPIDVTIIPDVKRSAATSRDRQKQLEGTQILASLSPADFVVLLDENGREMSSREFAAFTDKQMASGARRLVFVVGGPFGFSPEVYNRANFKLSLSRMTFNHEMVRLFFVEQLYRAQTILHNEPYHHD